MNAWRREYHHHITKGEIKTVNIYQKLIEVRKAVTYIQKADQGAQYSYTGSSRVLAAVRDKLDELGLLLIPSVVGHNLLESTVEFKDAKGDVSKRTTTYFTELEMTMTWVNAEKPDETIVSGWYGQGVDIAGEKGVGKALTYAEKYFMLKFFNIPTDKDDPDAFQAKHDSSDIPSTGSKQEAKNVLHRKMEQEKAKAANNKPATPAPTGDKISAAQLGLFTNKAKQSGYVTDEQITMLKADLLDNFGVSEPADLPKAIFNKVLTWIQEQTAPIVGVPDDDSLPF